MRKQAVLFLTVMAATILLLLAHPSPATARTIQGAFCTPGSAQATYLLGYKKYAESFSPKHSGKLTRGFIETYNVLDQPATYTVEIWTADLFGLPTGSSPLASTTVNNPHQHYEFEYPIFSSPAKVTAGKNYALVVTVPDANNNGVVVDPGNLCADTFSLNQTGTGAFTADSSNRDMEYAIFITFKRHHHH